MLLGISVPWLPLAFAFDGATVLVLSASRPSRGIVGAVTLLVRRLFRRRG
jgi:hypothetical protein